MLRVSEVSKHSKSFSIDNEPNNQAMADQGVAIDLIGHIYPPSSKGHKFVLVATDYFTKWVEAIPIKTVTSGNMIDFVKEHIFYQFGIPQTITIDQGS
jgi:hypothetical protein